MDMRFLPFAIATRFATLSSHPVEAQLPPATEVAPGHLPRADVDFILDANSANITQIAMGHAADDQGAKPGIHSLANASCRAIPRPIRRCSCSRRRSTSIFRAAPTSTITTSSPICTRARRGGDFDAQYVQATSSTITTA